MLADAQNYTTIVRFPIDDTCCTLHSRISGVRRGVNNVTKVLSFCTDQALGKVTRAIINVMATLTAPAMVFSCGEVLKT